MSVKCSDIISIMEEIAPLNLAEKWDNPGLLLGDTKAEVRRVLVALDATDDVVEEARAMGAELIVTHHPLIFSPIKSITRQTHLGNRLYNLIQNGINVYCAHTNLDVAWGGTNDFIAEMAGLENVKILEETHRQNWKKLTVFVPLEAEKTVRDAICLAGVGKIGCYSDCTFSVKGTGRFCAENGSNPYVGDEGVLCEVDEIRMEATVTEQAIKNVVSAMLSAHPYEMPAYDITTVENSGQAFGIGRIGDLKESMRFGDFANILKTKLGLSHMRVTGNLDTYVKTVGLCTGSGMEFLNKAKRQGADVYITGDIKFHELQEALDEGICVIDATHYASENCIVPVLCEYISTKAKQKHIEVEVNASKVNGQTFQYI